MFELPPDNSGKHTYASVGYTLSIAANGATKYPSQVKTFFNFVAAQPVDEAWATRAGSIAPLDAKEGVFPSYLSAADKPLAAAGRLLINPSYEIQNPAFTTDYTNDLVGLFTGQQTVSSSLADLDANWAATTPGG
jgi:hypothetical protein